MTHPTTITATPGLPFVEIVREFDAPAAAVFRAHTDPDLVARWMGPAQYTMDIVEYDATTGGRWQYVSRGQGGETFGFRGVFHTVEPNTRIIQTFEFDGAPGQVGLGTMTLEEVDGRTHLVSHEVYPSVEARDAAVASGMEHGIVEGYQRLDALLAQRTGA
jgi:uncharacterized protein YndB with AHSA1/START domain